MTQKNLHIVAYVAAAFILTVWSAGTASAVVSEQVIYTFTGVLKGLYPLTKLVDGAGKLYGATSSGGTATCKCGTVFGLVTKTGGGWTYRTLYSFKGGSDGSTPVGNIIFDTAGNIYGVTGSGGSQGFGTVYELSPGTGGKWTHKVLYDFSQSPDGNGPNAGLIMDAAGNLYGTTNSGGNNFSGTVFELSWARMGCGTKPCYTASADRMVPVPEPS
jgi:uncharacterized repeat protein (TIGR03803 family)